MGGFPSHDIAYQSEREATTSEIDFRGSLRLLTDLLTRQHTTKKYRGKILFLGLDGAGKSTLVNHLSRASVGEILALYTKGLDLPSYLYPDPTHTLQASTFRIENTDRYLHLLDPPGRRSERTKWYSSNENLSTFGKNNPNSHTFQTALPILAVLFVIDVSDSIRFPIVAMELIRLFNYKMKNQAFLKTQLYIVFNKMDQFLPSIPPEIAEEPQTKEYQQLWNQHKQEQRAAMREARQELKKCIEYAGKMDARRHPVKSNPPFASPIVLTTPETDNRNCQNSTLSAVSSLFTNYIECCAYDRDNIQAMRTWLNEELKKPLANL